MNSEPVPTVVPAGQGEVIRAYGDEVQILLGARQTAGAFTMFHDLTPPGGGPPPHFHLREDEWWFVLEGQAEFFDGETWTAVGPGGAVFMPRNSLHTFRNAGDGPLKQIIHTSPAGFEGFFKKSGEVFQAGGAPDLNRILEIGAAAGIYFPTLQAEAATQRGQPALPPAITPPGQGRGLRAFGDEIQILLDAGQTGGRFVAFLATVPPGGGPPPHVHAAEDEWFYLLEGRLSFLAGGQWIEVSPGAAVFAPRKSAHTFKNIGATPVKMLVHASPSGFEKFFAAAAVEFTRTGGPDLQRVTQIAMEHGIHFVQP